MGVVNILGTGSDTLPRASFHHFLSSAEMNEIMTYIADNQLRILDILSTVVGIVYIILEYRASIWLWFASIIMPLIDIVLYLEAGLYADFGMAIY